MLMTLIDTHAHLDQLNDLDAALQNAVQAGVEGIVAVSMDLDSCRKNLDIKKIRQRPVIHLGMGIHPSEAGQDDYHQCLQFAREHAGELKAIGEIGLDFWYRGMKKDEEKRNEQRDVFRAFLCLAKELDLPAIIHSRGAWRECLELVRETGVSRAVFHWYSGPLDVLDDILSGGYYVSASPSLAYSPQSREAMERAPVERTLIETDCPVYYGNKETGEGFRSEPKDVFKTLKAYCGLKKMDEGKALEILNRNAKEFFRIDP